MIESFCLFVFPSEVCSLSAFVETIVVMKTVCFVILAVVIAALSSELQGKESWVTAHFRPVARFFFGEVWSERSRWRTTANKDGSASLQGGNQVVWVCITSVSKKHWYFSNFRTLKLISFSAQRLLNFTILRITISQCQRKIERKL